MTVKKRYPKGSAWRRGHWDKWGFWRKTLHVLSVVLGLIIIVAMFLIAAYVVLIVFGVYGFILHVRDTILLGIMHSIFG
ncbi:MAG: hypothetical protein ACTSWJ_02390 [Candidatus Heimdallarchaeaceae archaeon]